MYKNIYSTAVHTPWGEVLKKLDLQKDQCPWDMLKCDLLKPKVAISWQSQHVPRNHFSKQEIRLHISFLLECLTMSVKEYICLQTSYLCNFEPFYGTRKLYLYYDLLHSHLI